MHNDFEGFLKVIAPSSLGQDLKSTASQQKRDLETEYNDTADGRNKNTKSLSFRLNP